MSGVKMSLGRIAAEAFPDPMPAQLKVSLGQRSDRGRKEINQDFHGACIPREPLLSSKGIAIALADGISSSDVGQIASQTAVTGFLEDYYCTPDAWSVKTSAQRVLQATNSWLHSQTRRSQYRYDRDRGYVCTLSVMVIKSATAHIFHAGDARIYRLRDARLEQLTEDHRVWVSEEMSCLGRAFGVDPRLEIDYRSLPVYTGDIFVFATDGVYDHIAPGAMLQSLADNSEDLDRAAKTILDKAFEAGSTDNLTIQIARIDELPPQNSDEISHDLLQLPFPSPLEARSSFEGYTITRELKASGRSHVYLAVDDQTGAQVAIKIPSIETREDHRYIERFLMEEWIATRIDSPHVLKARTRTRKRNYIYTVTEFIDGRTLSQWMIDNHDPDIETVRNIIEQIAKGLRAFHRLEILHQDVRPDNIMIDRAGTVKIIDFGSARIEGIMEMSAGVMDNDILGTTQYTAPEYFLGEGGTTRSDLFSLGIIAYQMLSGGRLPYGTRVSNARTRAAQRKLTYTPLHGDNNAIPLWIDEAIRKAVRPDPHKRYQELSEFLYDLRHPNKDFLNRERPPLMEREPALFWKGVSLVLTFIIIILLVRYEG